MPQRLRVTSQSDEGAKSRCRSGKSRGEVVGSNDIDFLRSLDWTGLCNPTNMPTHANMRQSNASTGAAGDRPSVQNRYK